MPPAKKLQVFVSSTYTDLRDERQAAVEAILTAGHIPAGMELFTSGDESQMDVIRRWIDESDVFLLILGGRYGSLEPLSGKSYVHLEYEYAIDRGKPLFAVVVTDEALDKRVKRVGKSALELESPARLCEFRELVLSRISEFWSDQRDIALTVHRKLSEFTRRTDLVGWIRGDDAVSTGILAEEIARLTKENGDLRRRVESAGSTTYHGLSFQKMRTLLCSEVLEQKCFTGVDWERLEQTAIVLGNDSPTLLDLLWHRRSWFTLNAREDHYGPTFRYFDRLAFYGLITIPPADLEQFVPVQLTDEGRKLLFQLMIAA